MSVPSSEFVALQERLAGRYSLERETGRGPLLVRFLARDVRLERPVVIELLRPDPAPGPEVRERFVAGARSAAGLFHPHILPVHAVEERDGLAFFVRAHVDGETLADRVAAQGPMRPFAVRRMVEEVAWALEQAQARGVVHGSLDPAHILLDAATGRTLVTGFGMSEVLDPASDAFRPPERAGGAPPDGRGDLFALGACARFALTGRTSGAAPDPSGRTPEEFRLALAGAARPRVRGSGESDAVPDDVPPELAHAIALCLSRDPRRRPASAADLAAEVAAPGALPATLPASARRLLRRIRQFSPAAVTGLVVLWFTRDASAQAVITSLVGGTLGLMGMGLVRAARDVLRDGLDRDLVTQVLEAEAEELSTHPDAEPRKLQNFAIGCGGWLFVLGMFPVAIFILGTLGSILSGGGLVAFSYWSDVSAAGLLLVTLLFLAGPSEPQDSPRRWLDFGERMMVGRFGRVLFPLAGIGLGSGDRRERPTLGEPTALALSDAVDELFAGLPADVRRPFAEAPAAVRDLREHVRELHERERELEEALAELDGGHGTRDGTADATGDTSAEGDTTADDRDALARSLEAGRARVRQRISEATASLEHLRLGMLRLAARGASEEEAVGELTVQLERARRIRSEADELVLGRAEVRRLLDGSAPSAAGGE